MNILFSISLIAKSKAVLLEIFEALSHFPDISMMLRSGDYTVDAHSIIGVFSIDVTNTIELILNQEPCDELKNAVSKYTLTKASA